MKPQTPPTTPRPAQLWLDLWPGEPPPHPTPARAPHQSSGLKTKKPQSVVGAKQGKN